MARRMFYELSEHVQGVFTNLCADGVTPEENYEGFRSVGIPVGVYLYSYALSVNDAKKEAQLLERVTSLPEKRGIRKCFLCNIGLLKNEVNPTSVFRLLQRASYAGRSRVFIP